MALLNRKFILIDVIKMLKQKEWMVCVIGNRNRSSSFHSIMFAFCICSCAVCSWIYWMGLNCLCQYEYIMQYNCFRFRTDTHVNQSFAHWIDENIHSSTSNLMGILLTDSTKNFSFSWFICVKLIEFFLHVFLFFHCQMSARKDVEPILMTLQKKMRHQERRRENYTNCATYATSCRLFAYSKCNIWCVLFLVRRWAM